MTMAEFLHETARRPDNKQIENRTHTEDYTHLTRQQEPDQCQTRGEALFVEHVLIYCRKYTDNKNKIKYTRT